MAGESGSLRAEEAEDSPPKLPICFAWKIAGRGKRRWWRVVATTLSPIPRNPTGRRRLVELYQQERDT